jgi:hypothetical protein
MSWTRLLLTVTHVPFHHRFTCFIFVAYTWVIKWTNVSWAQMVWAFGCRAVDFCTSMGPFHVAAHFMSMRLTWQYVELYLDVHETRWIKWCRIELSNDPMQVEWVDWALSHRAVYFCTLMDPSILLWDSHDNTSMNTWVFVTQDVSNDTELSRWMIQCKLSRVDRALGHRAVHVCTFYLHSPLRQICIDCFAVSSHAK